MCLKEQKGEMLIPPHLNLEVECIASIYLGRTYDRKKRKKKG